MSKVSKAKYRSEVSPGFTHRTAMEEAARCLLCHDAPCSARCPAGTNPGKFIRSIRFRNPKGAAETIRENNVLGGSCARVCPYDRLCEEACSRCGIDRPIEIGRLQRYAIEQEKLFGMKILVPPGGPKIAKAACIGAGPASLACAAELAKAGCAVTVFEANERAGGMLSYGITPARLPQSVVDWDIECVKGLGVKFVFGTTVGKDLFLDDLKKEGFEVFFIGAGLWDSKAPGIEGVRLKGVYAAIDFLKKARSSGGRTDLAGKSVVVIGGGDVAMDCAATAKLTGAANVAVYYRRTLEEAPANMDELNYVFSLGIPLMTNFAPAKIHGSGKVDMIEFKGRDEKSFARVAADVVIFATGQGPKDFAAMAAIELTEQGCIRADRRGKTGIPGIFAGGDAVNGGKTVVEAVAGGKAAAAEMIKWLGKKKGAH